MLSNIGPTELIIIGVVLILLFGSKKIAELARDLGESTKELEKVKKEYSKAVGNEALASGDQEKKDSGKAVEGEALASQDPSKEEVKQSV